MLPRFAHSDGRLNEPAMLDGFVAKVRHAMRAHPGFTLGEHMDDAWRRIVDEAAAERAGVIYSQGRGPTVRVELGQLFSTVFNPVDPVTARRARLIRFADRMNGDDPRSKFRLRLGDAVIRYESLTDDALEDVCSDMVRDFWFQKKLLRENRAGRAKWVAEQEARLQAAV